jgi:transposase-like protein
MMNRQISADQLAVRYLLNGDQNGLRRLNAEIRRQIGEECPNCGGRSIESNGCNGCDAGYLCTDCGHQWEA